MTLEGFSAAHNLLAVTPLLLTLVAAAFAWNRVAWRWTFLIVGCLVAYVVAGIAWLWVLIGIGIAGEDTPAGRVISVMGPPNGPSALARVLLAHLLVLAFGAFVFGLLGRWLRKPPKPPAH
jgi:hypothetical protein